MSTPARSRSPCSRSAAEQGPPPACRTVVPTGMHKWQDHYRLVESAYLKVVDAGVRLVAVRGQEAGAPLARPGAALRPGYIGHKRKVHHRVLKHTEPRRAGGVHALHLRDRRAEERTLTGQGYSSITIQTK